MIPKDVSIISALQKAASKEPLGLYLHIPFCRDRCTYCSFASIRDESLKKIVVEQLCSQILEWGRVLDRPSIDTLYMGGGTPSILTVAEVREITCTISKAFDISSVEEATIEVNPGTVSADWLRYVRDLGWDRISIGVQTLDDVLLRNLGRIHNSQVAIGTLLFARAAGFTRVSGDLLVGVPGQDLCRVIPDAKSLVEYGISHISIYLLDLDKNCVLRAQVDSGITCLPTDDRVADTFEALQEELPRLGLLPYEISNYAVVGQNSRHNSRYWERRPYLGIGPSAASQLGIWRWMESSNIRAWINNENILDVQKLSEAEILAETPLLGLRMHNGVNWEDLRVRGQILNLNKLVESWEQQLLPFISYGLLIQDGPNLRLTTKGMLLSNSVFQVFV